MNFGSMRESVIISLCGAILIALLTWIWDTNADQARLENRLDQAEQKIERLVDQMIRVIEKQN